MKKTAIFFLVFILVGEGLLRFDKEFDFLNKNANAIIRVELAESELRDRVEQGEFDIKSDQLRVLVLGDSYIFGSFIGSEKKFSTQLQKDLNNSELGGKQAVVLDVSRASNNTSDNFDFLKYYNDIFKPHIVFWAYHYNDIQDLRSMEETASEEEITLRDEAAKRKVSVWKAIVKRIYKTSELINFLSSSLQRELKLNGIILPFGDFYALTQQTYHEKNKDWQLTKDIFEEVVKICKDENMELIVYKLPIFNLLDNNALLSKVDATLSDYFKQHEAVHYLYGYDDFKGEDSYTYRVSKYDGHPNENAHRKMANRTKNEILKIQEESQTFE